MKLILSTVVLLLSGCTTYNVHSDLSGARINIAVETPLGVAAPVTVIRDPHNPYKSRKP
jgi:hypothetical protein